MPRETDRDVDRYGGPLVAALVRQLRALREQVGASAERLAYAAQAHGLPWTKGSVNALEGGRRGLSADELVLLPAVAQSLVGRPVSWAELLGDAELVRVGGHLLPPSEVVELLHETPGEALRSRLAKGPQRAAGLEEQGELEQRVALAARGEAERKAAAVLLARAAPLEELTAEDVTRAAFGLYGRSLTEQREALLEQQVPADATARQRQAVRGHVTRRLLEELRPALVDAHNKATARADRREQAGSDAARADAAGEA